MLSIPIVSSFDNKGIKKAVQEFKQLEGASAKAQFALKKAVIPATAAIGALGAGLFDATKAAMEDQAAQQALARQLVRSTKATDAQIAANEDWIKTQGQLLGVTDDELRPALAGLARVTGSITKAQKAAALAMDISAAKGISLESATKVLERAYGGNLNAIARLVPEMKGMIKEGATLEQVMAKLNQKFGGEAAAAAETSEGKFRRLKVALDETKESVGEGLLPIVEGALPVLQRFADWASNNPQTFRNVAAGIAAVAASIVAVNIATAANPYVLAAAGVVVLALAFDKMATSIEKVNKFGGALFRSLGNLTGIGGLANGARNISGLVNRVRGGDDSGMGTLPGGTNIAPSMAPSMATAGNRGVVINVNTGVGDPVAIGKSVNDALNAYLRRSK
jgi:hypothetical protein